MDGGSEYTPGIVAAMEWIWGEGFLSPGGRDEVAAIVDGLDLAGKRILDIGAGLGGADLALAEAHGAGQVVGVDIDTVLLARARRLVEAKGFADRVTFEVIEPGPLPFDDSSFDIVFSKDAIIHVADKAALYADVLRILRPGGALAISDWLFDVTEPLSSTMEDWLEFGTLSFALETPANVHAVLGEAGIIDIALDDRNAWYGDWIRREVERTSGEEFDRLVEIAGREAAEHRRDSSARKCLVVDAGELRPTHIRAHKPM